MAKIYSYYFATCEPAATIIAVVVVVSVVVFVVAAAEFGIEDLRRRAVAVHRQLLELFAAAVVWLVSRSQNLFAPWAEDRNLYSHSQTFSCSFA